MLRARIYDAEQERHAAEVTKDRRSQVGGADRSEKIRTYNFPQDRITDHRINASFHSIPRVLDGGLDDIINQLTNWEQEQLLEHSLA